MRAIDASPGTVLHLVQRAAPPEPAQYLARLRQAGCLLHAYALMGNHAHLLVSAARPGGASRLAAALEGAVSLWPVHARRYLLGCMRYIELNPVRAGFVARPGEWRGSSYRANALGEADALVTPHALYCALGRTPEARRAAWRGFVARAPATRAWRSGT
jgi:putative transposase